MKHSKVEACMICEEVPCVCYVKKPKSRSRKKDILCGPAAPIRADLTAVEEFKQELRTRFKGAKKTEVPDLGFDFETAQAIRNLANAELLTDVDQVKYRNVISPVPTTEVDRRLADWKKRNALV